MDAKSYYIKIDFSTALLAYDISENQIVDHRLHHIYNVSDYHRLAIFSILFHFLSMNWVSSAAFSSAEVDF